MGGGAGRPGESFENDTHACAREVQCSAVQSIGEREREREKRPQLPNGSCCSSIDRERRGEERRGGQVHLTTDRTSGPHLKRCSIIRSCGAVPRGLNESKQREMVYIQEPLSQQQSSGSASVLHRAAGMHAWACARERDYRRGRPGPEAGASCGGYSTRHHHVSDRDLCTTWEGGAAPSRPFDRQAEPLDRMHACDRARCICNRSMHTAQFCSHGHKRASSKV
jgi:hypothetical protein